MKRISNEQLKYFNLRYSTAAVKCTEFVAFKFDTSLIRVGGGEFLLVGVRVCCTLSY